MRSVFSELVKENNDSDQSISEEEDVNGGWSANWISLGNRVEKKGHSDILSERHSLRDIAERHSAIDTINFSPKTYDFCHEDEIEFPAFDNEDDRLQIPEMAPACILNKEIMSFPIAAPLSNSDEEIFEDDDRVSIPTSGHVKGYNGRGTWMESNREAEELAYSSRKPGCSSSYCSVPKLHNALKGCQGECQLSSSFCSPTHKEDPSLPKPENEMSALLVVQPTEEISSTTQKQFNKSLAELLEDYHEKVEQSENPEAPIHAVIQHGNVEHSMAEFLDCFQERSGPPKSNLKMHSRTKRRSRPSVKKSISSLGSRKIDTDFVAEAPESEQSSGDEDVPQKRRSVVPVKTMADQFQEFLGAVHVHDGLHRALPRQLGTGLFGKLQSVMQNEKEMEMLFLRRLCTDDWSKGANLPNAHENAYLLASSSTSALPYFISNTTPGDNSSISVKILSKSLEAKLIVCCCALVEDDENFQSMTDLEGSENSGRTTIIFSSKTPNDVELEVGNLIRIHPPWKEV